MKKEFYERVYKLTKNIPRGQVSTYKIIAEELGTGAYRAVGQALKNNPYPDVPCHRVIHSNRRVGKYFGCDDTRKEQQLQKEGVRINNGYVDSQHITRPKQ